MYKTELNLVKIKETDDFVDFIPNIIEDGNYEFTWDDGEYTEESLVNKNIEHKNESFDIDKLISLKESESDFHGVYSK